MYSFLLTGQSNMAGRGLPEQVTPIENPRLFVLRNGRWWPMYVPVNPDRPTAGTCLAESFADLCSRYFDEDIGLIPCADGGSSLDQWEPGGVIYDHAIMQAKLAMRNSRLAGILWHQGEADCAEQLYPHYEEKCTEIFRSMLKDLGSDDLPILVGGLGDFLSHCPYEPFVENYFHINDALRRMEKSHDNIGFVSAEGLGSKEDFLHFDSPSLRRFGERYFERYIELGIFPGKDEDRGRLQFRQMETL